MTQETLIPRDVLFGNIDKAQARISPDGQHLSFIAPVNGVLNVWVGPVNDLAAAKPVTNDTVRGIRAHQWAYTNKHILYIQDVGGNEDWHVYVTDLDTEETRDLTPYEKVAAQISALSREYPEEVLLSVNKRNPQFHDLFRVNLLTGERTLLFENEGFAGIMADSQYQVRIALQPTPDGGMAWFQRKEDSWEPLLSYGLEDSLTTSPLGFDKSGNVLYLQDSRQRDTAAMFALDLTTGEQRLLAENDRVDLGQVMAHPTEKTIQAVSFTHERREWTFFDEAVSADFDVLSQVASGEISVTARTPDDRVWIVAFLMDDGPVRYYIYDRDSKTASFLFTNRSAMDAYTFTKMHSTTVKARDGLDLVCYYSLPLNSVSDNPTRPNEPLPTILYVHGGPWARDEWGMHPYHQLFANRGYAVISVNFRGSTGFGKAFVNAGNLEWGRKMHEDLLDTVEWAVQAGITKRDAVAIVGGSYGGYAALAGLTLTPDVFSAGISIVGPSNLITLVESVPPYWQPMIEQFAKRMGDHRTEEGRAMLTERSPLTHVDKIQRPLLIGQGANDPRVTQQESDQIVEAMQAKGIPVTYALYPDEGHGFARPENSLAFMAIMEAFLGTVFEQDFQPLGEDLVGSSTQVPAGAEGVPGLPAALAELAA